jgi:hypothetical protein
MKEGNMCREKVSGWWEVFRPELREKGVCRFIESQRQDERVLGDGSTGH